MFRHCFECKKFTFWFRFVSGYTSIDGFLFGVLLARRLNLCKSCWNKHKKEAIRNLAHELAGKHHGVI